MELSVLKNTGEDTGRKVTLPESIFNIEPNDHAIYLDVKLILANKRQGTHKSKERNEIAGSTRKIKKQKGTGTARAGSLKSPIFRSGGRVFGPRPRTYGFKLNKKVKDLARKSVLAYKAQESNISVLEDFKFDLPKTKNYLKLLNDLALSDKKTLLVTNDLDLNLVLSSRNIKKAKVTTAQQVNTYDLMNADRILFFESSIGNIEKLLS
jgi:large subunit ribosomal protein L4